MNSPSAFQQQFPLSRRKFWKKIISRFFQIVIGSLFIGILGSVLLSLVLLTSKTQSEIGTFILICVLTTALSFVLIAGLYGAYVSAYIRRYYYDANDQFITIKKGVFAPTEIHVPYGKIQDVYVDQDVLDRIMGLYDVHIASATVTSGIEAHIDGVDAQVAEGLKNLLLNKIQYGGQSHPQMGGALPVQASANASVLKGSSAGLFSSKNYPIANAWIVAALLGNFWVSALYTFFIWAILLGKRNTLYELSWSQIGVVYVVIYISLAIWTVLWKNTFYFEFLPQFILMKDGVIKREEKHVPYRTLQNVLLNRTIADRFFGLSTVVIENAAMGNSKRGRASNITIPGQPVTKGDALVSELNRILSQGATDQGTGL